MVTRVGRNLVEITSDYSRLPTVRIPIEMAGGAVVNTSGQNTFLIERDRDPNRLDLSIDGVALIVHKLQASGGTRHDGFARETLDRSGLDDCPVPFRVGFHRTDLDGADRVRRHPAARRRPRRQ
ncbi:hypothetical protein [Hephaestia mangrovi]|uniref:hypothetical protein n=1 Tax=Hephaestia mangrovi TaxID=2873268 RepID=UPI001CA66EBE|nr:hypothetical protein [Hephaestia mangrovi]MBY8828904.1 hypothetical protein [Hephaestia mangrovi]